MRFKKISLPKQYWEFNNEFKLLRLFYLNIYQKKIVSKKSILLKPSCWSRLQKQGLVPQGSYQPWEARTRGRRHIRGETWERFCLPLVVRVRLRSALPSRSAALAPPRRPALRGGRTLLSTSTQMHPRAHACPQGERA